MSAAKKRKGASSSSDGESVGGCFGSMLGCAVILISLAAVLIGLFILPYVKEKGWSVDSVKAACEEKKDQVSDWFEHWKSKFSSTGKKVSKQAEKTSEEVEDWSEGAADKVKESLPPPAKKVKKPSFEEPTSLPGTESTSLNPSLIED